MPRLLDLKNQQFGRLTVLSEVGRSKSGHVLWFCRCSCGNQSTVQATDLRTGNTQSCGCLQAELSAQRSARIFTTHGHAVGKRSPTYRSWTHMVERCTNPKFEKYSCYGGANPPVKVCPEWMTFAGFLSSMGERPEGTSLGRILDMGDYTKSNCSWQDDAQQKLAARNKRALLKWDVQAHPVLQAA